MPTIIIMLQLNKSLNMIHKHNHSIKKNDTELVTEPYNLHSAYSFSSNGFSFLQPILLFCFIKWFLCLKSRQNRKIRYASWKICNSFEKSEPIITDFFIILHANGSKNKDDQISFSAFWLEFDKYSFRSRRIYKRTS